MKSTVDQHVSIVTFQGKRFHIFIALVTISGSVWAETNPTFSTSETYDEWNITVANEAQTFYLDNYDKDTTTHDTYLAALLTGKDILLSVPKVRRIRDTEVIYGIYFENGNSLSQNSMLEKTYQTIVGLASYGSDKLKMSTLNVSNYNLSAISTGFDHQSYVTVLAIDALFLENITFCNETRWSNSKVLFVCGDRILWPSISQNHFLTCIKGRSAEISNWTLYYSVHQSAFMDAEGTDGYLANGFVEDYVDYLVSTCNAQHYCKSHFYRNDSIDFGIARIYYLSKRNQEEQYLICTNLLSFNFFKSIVHSQNNRSRQHRSTGRENTKNPSHCALDLYLAVTVVFIQNFYYFVYKKQNEQYDLIYKDRIDNISAEVSGTLRDISLDGTKKTDFVSKQISCFCYVSSSEYIRSHSREKYESVIGCVKCVLCETIKDVENILNFINATSNHRKNKQSLLYNSLKIVEGITSFYSITLSISSHRTSILRTAFTPKLIRDLSFHMFQNTYSTCIGYLLTQHQCDHKLCCNDAVQTSASMTEKRQMHISDFGLCNRTDSSVKCVEQTCRRYPYRVTFILQEYAMYNDGNDKPNDQEVDGNLLLYNGNHPKLPKQEIIIYHDAYSFTFGNWFLTTGCRIHQHDHVLSGRRYQVQRHDYTRHEILSCALINDNYGNSLQHLVVNLLQLNVDVKTISSGTPANYFISYHLVHLRHRSHNGLVVDTQAIFILKSLREWWLFYTNSRNYNDAYVERLTRYELCTGCENIIRFPLIPKTLRGWWQFHMNSGNYNDAYTKRLTRYELRTGYENIIRFPLIPKTLREWRLFHMNSRNYNDAYIKIFTRYEVCTGCKNIIRFLLIPKALREWWLFYMNAGDYNDAYTKRLTRYGLCTGSKNIIRFSLIPKTLREWWLYYIKSVKNDAQRFTSYENIRSPRIQKFTAYWKVMLSFTIRLQWRYRIQYVSNGTITYQQLTSFLQYSDNRSLSNLNRQKHLQLYLLKNNQAQALHIYSRNGQNFPSRYEQRRHENMQNNNISYRCLIHKLTQRLRNHLHIQWFVSGFRVYGTCKVNFCITILYHICPSSAVIVPFWYEYRQGNQYNSHFTEIASLWNYTIMSFIFEMQPRGNIVISLRNISDICNNITRVMFNVYRSRNLYLRNRRMGVIIMMWINMKGNESVVTNKRYLPGESDRNAIPARTVVLFHRHLPVLINKTIHKENDTNVHFQRARFVKVVRRCYVLNVTTCNCTSSSENGNTTTEYIKIFVLKIFRSRYNVLRECLILIFVLLRWLNANVSNIFHQKYPKYEIHIRNNNKHGRLFSWNSYAKGYNRFCKGSNFQRNTRLHKPYKYTNGDMPSVLQGLLHDGAFSLKESVSGQRDLFSSFNSQGLSKHYDRSYLLSLGNTHQQVNAYTFPVYKTILDRHFESSLDDSSIDSSLGIELLRVGTFHNFPGKNAPSSLTLAKAGFFFTGQSDIVECFHCHMRYNTSGAKDDPFVVHRRISPSCAFINGQTNLNVPVPRSGENAGAVGGQTLIQTQNGDIPLLQNANGHTLSESYSATQRNGQGTNQSATNSSNKQSSQFQGHPYQNQSRERPYHNGLTNGFSPKQQTLAQSSFSGSSVETRNTAIGNGHVTNSGIGANCNTHLTQNSVNQQQQFGCNQTNPTFHSHAGLVNGTNYPPSLSDRRRAEQQIGMSRQPTENVPEQYSNRTALPRNNGLVNGINKPPPLEYRHGAQQQIGMSSQSMNNVPGQSAHRKTEAVHQPLGLEPLGIVAASPRYPAYAVLSVRMSTYQGWPSTSGKTPRQMAAAGFIFAGYSDYTRCFFCGGGLRNWEPEDDPWIEHAKWFPKCVYLRQNKGDSFVLLVHQSLNNPDILQATEINVNGEYSPAPALPAAAQSSNGTGMPTDTAAIQSVQEMGYSREIIDSAIAILRSDGKDVDAYNIMDVILSSDFEHSSTSSPPVQLQHAATNHEPEPASHEGQQQATGNSVDLTTLQLQEIGLSDIKSLVEENKSLKESRLCKVCLDNESSIAFVPCGHLVCCAECAFAMRKCPICRKQIEGRVKTWMG